jgi:hypothetical protein
MMIDVAHFEWSQNLSVLPYNVINGMSPTIESRMADTISNFH